MEERNCKIVVLGDSGVGKTTLIHHYINEEYRADFKATIGADFSSNTMIVDNKSVELQIWDTAGEVRFHAIGAAFYRGTNACIVVYDCTQTESFRRLEMWIEDLFTKSQISDTDGFPIVVFGNKSDLVDQREVDLQEAISWAEEKGYQHFSVSAKTGENVNAGFEAIVRLYLENSRDTQPITPFSIVLNPEEKHQEEKKCSC